MDAAGSGGEPGRPWTASATWAPAGGAAVEDAVSFETSADDAEAVPSAVVLDRPTPDGYGDAPPCEVTVHFSGRYEIHRVYVRSTARIYEIYYTANSKDSSKDYLCTVRCGLAVKEPLPSAEVSTTQWSSEASTSEKQEQETKSVSSSTDEDSWVEVKIPDLPVETNRQKAQEPNATGARQETALPLAHYEATAEITDASPCISLTVRLLSLQSKTSVHIEEIYIFADPIEPVNDEPETHPGNMGSSSLLAMLVPSLMQMSKSRNQKTDDKYYSGASQLSQGCAMKVNSPCENVAQEAGACDTNDLNFKSVGMESKQNATDSGIKTNENGNHYEFQLKESKSLLLPVQITENKQVPLVKNQSVPNTDQPVTPLMDENLNPYRRIEGKLDILLSKFEKMESYCSRFDDGMMRPLSSIESRLHRLEQQFASFSVEIQSLRVSSARMSVPDGLSDMTNPQGKSHDDGKAGSTASATNRQPGLVIRAPEFSTEESFRYDKSNENPIALCGLSNMPRLLVKAPDFVCESELTGEKIHDVSFSPVDWALSSEKEYKTSPGLVVKVPEFPNDEDGEVDEEKKSEIGDHDDGYTKSDDAPSKNIVNSSESKTPISVDGALASALAALLSSTKQKSCSQSVVCPASNSTAENTNDSSTSSFSLEQVDEISTKDGMAGEFSGTVGANKVDTSISYQEADADPHTCLSKANLDEIVEVNGQNNDFNSVNSDMMPFGASREPWCVSSQLRMVEECIDVGNKENQQNDDSNSGMMSSLANTDHIIAPPQPPIVLESINDVTQLNDDKSTLSLAEFLVARSANSCKNVISETLSGNDGAETHTFKRTSVGSAKDLQDIRKPLFTSQPLLVKKALVEVNEDDSTRFSVSGGMDSYYHHIFTDSKRGWTESSSLEASLSDSFTKPEVEHTWSDLSSMKSFIREPAREAVGSGDDTTGKHVDYLFTGSSSVNPTAEEELQKVYSLLDEYKDDILGMTFVAKRTRKSNSSLEVLLAESSASEGEISDAEDTDNDSGFGSARLFSTLSSSDDEAPATDELLVDVVNLPTTSEAYISSRNEMVDVVDLTNASGTYAPVVNEPLDNVVDRLNPSETCSSAKSEHLVSVDDQPKHSGTFAVEGTGECPDSLI